MNYNTATPDSVYIYDEDGKNIVSYYYTQMNCNPIPFGYDEYGALIVGECGQGHGELMQECGCHLDITGRFWDNKYITVWSYGELNDDKYNRPFYTKLYNDFQLQLRENIGDYIILFEGCENGQWYVYAVNIIDYIKGAKPIEFNRFINKDKEPEYDKEFAPKDGTPDMPLVRKKNRLLWKYGYVDEGKKKGKLLEWEDNADYASADLIKLHDESGNVVIDYKYYDETIPAIPFIISYDRIYFGKNGNSHYDIEREFEEEYGRAFPFDYSDELRGRLYHNDTLMLWGRNIPNESARKAYARTKELFKQQADMDVSNYTVYFENNHWVFATTVREFVMGKQPIPFQDYYEAQKRKAAEVPTAPNGMAAKDFWRHYQMVGESVEEHDLYWPGGTPHGNPDEIYLPDRNRERGMGFVWNSPEDKQIAFIIYDGKLYVGNEDEVHDDIRKTINKHTGSNFRYRGDEGQIEGRIYDNQIMSLWTYVDPYNIGTQNACKEIIRAFNERALKIKANEFDATTRGPLLNNVGNMAIVFEPSYGTVYAATLKDYAATGKFSRYLDYFYPEKSDYEKEIEKKDWGKNQWRHYEMVGEEAKKDLKESYRRHDFATPDVIQLYDDDKSHELIYMRWDKEGAFPFIVIDNNLYTGNEGESHYDVECAIEDYPYNSETGEIRGRIFDREDFSVFMLWNFRNAPFEPKTREVYKHIYTLFKVKERVDISDMVTFFQVTSDEEVFAIRVRDYIAGRNPIPYKEFFEQEARSNDQERREWERNQWRHYDVSQVAEQIKKRLIQEMKKRGGK